MVNTGAPAQEKSVDTSTYPQIARVALPLVIAEAFPHLAAVSQTYQHPPLFTVDDGAEFRDGLPGRGSKNLFLKDKKGTLWLLTAWHDTKIDLTAFANMLRNRNLAASRFSFCAPELLKDVLHVTPGTVTPLALLNDRAHRVNFAIDAALLDGDQVSCHPLRNDMTTVMPPAALMACITGLGYRPLVVEFGEMIRVKL